ncbi:MAG TPA: hypothetical protein VM243_00240 [Phycisphaerae bacterium]|nr:hypothetical protein [Phycisphaerae bacterium]
MSRVGRGDWSRRRCFGVGAGRRRAYLVGQMVAILPLLLAAAGLAIMGTHAALRTQMRSAENAANDTAIDTFLETLRQDTWAGLAGQGAFTDASTSGFALQTHQGQVTYVISGGCVTRTVIDADQPGGAVREWSVKDATFVVGFDGQHGAGEDDAGGSASEGGFKVLTVRIRWRGQSRHDVDPTRRIEATFSVGRGYQR